MQKYSADIILFLIVVSVLILAMVLFIVSTLYIYRKKQIAFINNIEQLRIAHEKTLMQAQLEMQESTFQHISREIHDNINLSLTLAKLQLNTFNWNKREQSETNIGAAIELLSQAIRDLSDISKGLNADFIKQNGLIKALEDELQKIRQAGLFEVVSIVSGDPIYMEAKKELIVFRIIQEAFSNILRHADANASELTLHYHPTSLHIIVSDNGRGFDAKQIRTHKQAGLKNMQVRARMLGGNMEVASSPGCGTILSFNIPFE